MKIKIDYKKIILVLAIILVSCFVLNGVQAAITVNAYGNASSVDTSKGSAVDTTVTVVQKLIEMILGAAASGIFATITSLINVLFIALYLVLHVLFGLSIANGTELFYAPMPDNIVFNRFSFFDANFINPSKGSICYAIKGILQNLFASFETIAFAIFIIAAMVAGIKMALSSIASKRAQYKEAAVKWFSGFLILLCLRWIIAGIFYINEYIVAVLYSISTEVPIPVYVTDAIPIFGQALTSIIKVVASLWGGDGTFNVSGYMGIVLANLAKSFGGDVIASIIGFIIMGQTFTVIGSYLKRVFMCVLLGVISPLIVAADTISTATGKQSTIFKKWLSNFVVTVFMQSLHAMYMVVILEILKELYAEDAFNLYGLNGVQIGVITVILTTGLVKLEGLFKNLFDIQGGLSGSLKDGTKDMVKAMGAIKGIAAGAKAVGDNATKFKDASKRKKAYTAELSKLKGAQARDNAQSAFTAAKKAKSEGNMDEYHKQRKIAADQLKIAKENGVYVDPKKGFGSNNSQGSAPESQKSGSNNADYLQQVLNAQNNPTQMTREQKIQQLEAGIASAQADMKSARFAQIMGPANIAAGLGMGLGMGQDVSEALFKGGYITAALDKGAEGIGRIAADKDRKTFAEYERKEGDRLRLYTFG